MGKKQFYFFQTAETGNRTPDSGVKGSGANHYPRAPAPGDVETVLFQCITLITFEILDQTSPNVQGSRRNGCEWCVQNYM